MSGLRTSSACIFCSFRLWAIWDSAVSRRAPPATHHGQSFRTRGRYLKICSQAALDFWTIGQKSCSPKYSTPRPKYSTPRPKYSTPR